MKEESKIPDEDYSLNFIPKEKTVPLEALELIQHGKFDEAVNYLDEILKNDKSFEDAWEKKALAHYLAQEFEDAMAACNSTLEINPNNLNAKKIRKQSLDEMGRKKKRTTRKS